MIFLTLGSQKFQFNRLLKAVDKLVEIHKIKDEIFAQTGYSDYKPNYYPYKNFLDRDEFSSMIDKCELVITHGGTGAIITAVKRGKKVLAVPRLAEYGEHVDNHQEQIIKEFKESNLIWSCDDCEKLDIDLEFARRAKFRTYSSNTKKIIDSIDQFLNEKAK